MRLVKDERFSFNVKSSGAVGVSFSDSNLVRPLLPTQVVVYHSDVQGEVFRFAFYCKLYYILVMLRTCFCRDLACNACDNNV